MSWFKKLIPSKIRTDAKDKKGVPEGVWVRCSACTAMLYRKELEKVLMVCPKCNHHMQISARKRLEWFFDKNTIHELAEGVMPVDRLKFKDSKK